MSKFSLKETTVSVRGNQIRVRELTQGERIAVLKAGQEDGFRIPAVVMARGAIEPKWTEEEVADEAADVVEAVVKEIMSLSGMGDAGDSKND